MIRNYFPLTKVRVFFQKKVDPKIKPASWENKLSSLFPRRIFMQELIIFHNQSSWSGTGWCSITAESGQFPGGKNSKLWWFFPCPIFSLCVSVLSVKNAPFDMARSITVSLRISRKKSCNSVRKSRVKFYHTSPLEGTHIELHLSKTNYWTKISQKPNMQ